MSDQGAPSRQTANGHYIDDAREGTTYEFQVRGAADAIEQETPPALDWSATVTEATVTPATGVRATATHNTITVTWGPAA